MHRRGCIQRTMIDHELGASACDRKSEILQFSQRTRLFPKITDSHAYYATSDERKKTANVIM
jgi:hypothetical protein